MLHAAPRTCYLSPSLPSSLNSPPPVLSLTRSHIVSLPPSQPGRGAVTGSGCIVGAEAGTRRTCHVEPCCTMACPRRCDAETACVSVWMLPNGRARASLLGKEGSRSWMLCPLRTSTFTSSRRLVCLIGSLWITSRLRDTAVCLRPLPTGLEDICGGEVWEGG